MGEKPWHAPITAPPMVRVIVRRSMYGTVSADAAEVSRAVGVDGGSE